ncbi:hypothetical protein [Aquabacterium sp.]|nr:hypothetical protein [Aquabacterium sp.]
MGGLLLQAASSVAIDARAMKEKRMVSFVMKHKSGRPSFKRADT